MSISQNTTVASAAPYSFATTHWSVVLSAAEGGSLESAAALESLCRSYWHPLYVFVRRRGYSPHDAQDLTQAFFGRLLEKGMVRGVDRSKGKFRSFLLAALKNFLANEWRNAHTQKRGGRAKFVSLEGETAEHQYLQVASSGLSPEKLFERQWATRLLEQVLVRLKQEWKDAEKAALFDDLKIFLSGERPQISYADLAQKLSMSEASLKMTVSRMRRRYGELLRAEIAHTVSAPDQINDELQALFSALS